MYFLSLIYKFTELNLLTAFVDVTNQWTRNGIIIAEPVSSVHNRITQHSLTLYSIFAFSH
jgi:hypothetical protein